MKHAKFANKTRRILCLAVVLALAMATVAMAAPPAAPVPVLGTVTASTVTVSWPAVSDATSYRVAVDGTTAGTTANTAYTVTNLEPERSYVISVYAVNADGESTAGTVEAETVANDMPANLSLGINVADLFQGVTLIGRTFWPVIAVMAALGLGFWFLNKTRRIIGGRK